MSQRNRHQGQQWLAWWVQGLVLAALAAGVVALVGHALGVLRARGVQSGFDFLLQPAGFQIAEGWLDFEADQPFWRAFAAGLVNTVRVAIPAALLTVALGLVLGIGRLVPHALLRGMCTVYIETVRNIPLLVQLLMVYFVLTQLLPDAANALQPLPGLWISKSGLSFPWPQWPASSLWPVGLEWPERSSFNVSGGAALTPEFVAVCATLGLYTASFVAEIVRAGIQSVSAGQVHAARALGMSPAQSMRLVVLPQALRVIVPSLTNQLLNLTKNSSLAVAMGYPELVSVVNTSMSQTGRAFECIAVLMLVYLSISLLIAWAMNRYNARVALKGWQ